MTVGEPGHTFLALGTEDARRFRSLELREENRADDQNDVEGTTLFVLDKWFDFNLPLDGVFVFGGN